MVDISQQERTMVRAGTTARQADLYRDRYGVPHVFGDSLEGAYFGLGYCSAQDRPQTQLLHQHILQGRLAEKIGDVPLPDANLPVLDSLAHTPWFRGYGDGAWVLDRASAVDKWMRMWDYSGLGAAGLADLSDRSLTMLDAFCDGVNHFFEKNGAPDWFEPYEPATEIAWWCFFEHTISISFFISNSFAVAPQRTADGSAVVGGDLHYWFFSAGHTEAHISCPELELSGLWDGHVNLAMWGGSNTHIALGITAAGLEGASVYRDRLNPENREEYWDWRQQRHVPVEHRAQEVKVLDGPTETFVARHTHHGPLVAEGVVNGAPVAYAVRSPYLERPGVNLDQHLQLWTKKTVAEAVELVEASPFLRGHRLLIDSAGDMAYMTNGPVAVRDASFDWSKPVDGSIPDTEWQDEIWTFDGDENVLPKVVNPSCGFISSANDPPWCATVPAAVDEGNFPEYVFPAGWRELGPRGARQRAILSSASEMTEAELHELVYDIFVPGAYYGVRTLRRAYGEHRDQLPELSPGAAAVDAALADWDGKAYADSPAMTYAFYLNRLLQNGLPAVRVEMNDRPHDVPEMNEPELDSESARTHAVAYGRALEQVADTLEGLFGTVHKPWGEVHVLERPDELFPLPGGCNELRALCGTWRGWWDVHDELDDEGIERCNFGSRTLRVIQLGPNGLKVHSNILTGQVPANEHPGGPHALDQARLYGECRLKPLPLTREEVVEDAREQDHANCNHEAHEVLRSTEA